MRRVYNLPLLFPGVVALCFLTGCHKNPPAEPVRATTGEARDIQENSVVVTGTIDFSSLDWESALDWGFLFSQDPGLSGNTTEEYACKTVFPNDQIMMKIESLSAGTTYYYAAYVKILGKSWTGEVKSFKTPGNPIPFGAVDIGLSVYWADRNEGASLPGEGGTSLPWNEATALPLESSWRMPTSKDFEELYATYTDSGYQWTWTRADDACYGWEILFRKNGNRVFFPCPTGSSPYYGEGVYWSSSVSEKNPQLAWAWMLYSGVWGIAGMKDLDKSYGYQVRAVSDKY